MPVMPCGPKASLSLFSLVDLMKGASRLTTLGPWLKSRATHQCQVTEWQDDHCVKTASQRQSALRLSSWCLFILRVRPADSALRSSSAVL